jgi:hypothetical protein
MAPMNIHSKRMRPCPSGCSGVGSRDASSIETSRKIRLVRTTLRRLVQAAL